MNSDEPSLKRNQTLRMLKDRPASLSLKNIAEKTGLTYGWLCMFHQGKIVDPSYNRLQTLYEYLINNHAKV